LNPNSGTAFDSTPSIALTDADVITSGWQKMFMSNASELWAQSSSFQCQFARALDFLNARKAVIHRADTASVAEAGDANTARTDRIRGVLCGGAERPKFAFARIR